MRSLFLLLLLAVDLPTGSAQSDMFNACATNDVDRVRELLAESPFSIDKKGSQGQSPLMVNNLSQYIRSFICLDSFISTPFSSQRRQFSQVP